VAELVRPKRRTATGVASVLLVLLLAIGTGRALGGGDALPATPAEALGRAKPAIDAARTATQAQTPDIVKDIRRAVELMQPHVKSGSGEPAWAAAWNEALTLSRFHGVKSSGQYVLEPMRQETLSIDAWVRRRHSRSKHVGGCVLFGLPRGRGWRFEPKRPGEDEQCWGEIRRGLPGTRTAALVEISVYEFDVLYSGVGGENSTALAEGHLGYYVEKFSEITSRSSRVTARPLNKSFARCHYFEVVGTMNAGGRARVRSYFVKGVTRTYAFDVTEFRDPKPADSPFAVWQMGVEDPELDAVLDSIAEGEVQDEPAPRPPR
jgi:hypothetical protein